MAVFNQRLLNFGNPLISVMEGKEKYHVLYTDGPGTYL